ncbi:MAG TPA: CdaR family protein [Saprospiraceae bacterium]|nr:CdaR family protein [Saprospiraceae bacterium]HMP23328.1 CdaR family protein [Saprospiraceae bacterium]
MRIEFVLPEGRAFSEQPPAFIRPLIEGRGWELMFDFFIGQEIILRYNLAETSMYELSSEQLRSDIHQRIAFSNIRITDLNANDIRLTLEETTTRRVPVILQDSLGFVSGYHLTRPVQIRPDSVTLTGPASALAEIESWATKPLVLLNLKSNVTQVVPLSRPPDEIMLEITEVQANIQVEQVTEKSLFIPLHIRNAPADSLRYFPEVVKVTCVVGLSDYNNISVNDFRLEIDLARAESNAGKNTVPIVIAQQPPYVISVRFSPKAAEFFILKEE